MNFETLINRLPKQIVDSLKSTEQSPIWHAEGNVYIHTKMVFDEAVKTGDPDILVASIFHDLGKIDTHKETLDKDGKVKISHIGHERISLKYIDKYFHLYEDISTNKEKVIELVKNHMKAHLYTSGKLKKPAKREAFEQNPYFEEILLFSECDERGRIPG